MTVKTLSSTTLFSLMVFIMTNCCDSNLVDEHHFSKNDLSINPYSGTEILIFNNLNGAIKTFSSGTRTSTIYTQYLNVNAAAENKKCKGDYLKLESNTTTFQSQDDSLHFSISLYFDWNSTGSITRKEIVFISRSNLNKDNYPAQSDLNCYFDNDTIYNYEEPYNDSTYTYHNSITLGSKSFKNVYELHLIPEVFSSVTKFYYSKKEGIIGFDTQHSGLWYLDRINK